MANPSKNHYETLGVPKDGSDEMIRDAYKKLALKWHPDKNLDNKFEANEKFKEISVAYQVLSDSQKRKMYDRGDERTNERGFGSYGFRVPPDFFDMFFVHMFTSRFAHSRFCYDFDDDDDDGDYRYNSNPFRNRQQSENVSNGRQRQAQNAAKPKEQANQKKNTQAKAKKKAQAKPKTEPQTKTRSVNGKKWVTKTYYENDREIIERYEDGYLFSKRINGLEQLGAAQ